MAELKTKSTKINVDDFLNKISDQQKREDGFAILKNDATNHKRKTKNVGNKYSWFW